VRADSAPDDVRLARVNLVAILERRLPLFRPPFAGKEPGLLRVDSAVGDLMAIGLSNGIGK
jgi:hypothetical protein